jgi:GNAT superfamily N-acetyltransferase
VSAEPFAPGLRPLATKSLDGTGRGSSLLVSVNDLLPIQSDSRRGYWLCQCAGWGLYFVVNTVAAVAIGALPWLRTAVQVAVMSAIGFALSHLLHFVLRRQRWGQLRWAARTGRILVASLILGMIAAVLGTFLGLASWQTAGVAIGSAPLRPLLVFGVQTTNWMFLFVVWSGLYFAALSVRERRSAQLRESELARALQEAELRLLKSQLNPHFLFNALNTVRALIADEPGRAQSAVTQLARTLRYTLQSGQDELVTLDQELTIVEDYLELEALRLGERLRVDCDIAPEARGRRIPVMLLQTLVENAIKHGIAELPAGGVLGIHAEISNGVLILEVKNDRPEHLVAASPDGIGIGNAQRRLRLLFGPEAALDLDLSRPAWALARVCLPLAP